MAAGEPSKGEVMVFQTPRSVAVWAQLPDAFTAALLFPVGGLGRRAFSFDWHEIDEAIESVKVGENNITLIEKGLIRSSWVAQKTAEDEKAIRREHFDRVVEGIKEISEEAKSAAEAAVSAVSSNQPPPPPGPQVHLKQAVSQVSEETAPLLSAEELSAHWDRFKNTFGRDPKADEECTSDQLTGVAALSKRRSHTSTLAREARIITSYFVNCEPRDFIYTPKNCYSSCGPRMCKCGRTVVTCSRRLWGSCLGMMLDYERLIGRDVQCRLEQME